MEREKLIATVCAAQNGDSDALNELFNAFYNDVYYFALKTVKDDDLACDITQETFVEIINTIGDLHEPAAFVKWMKQITYHQCTRYFKKKKDILVDEDEEGNTIFDTLAEDKTEFIPDEALDQQDFRDTILAMLDELSEEQRSATMLYYYDEMPVKQIAEIQNVSEGTVKSRLNYARKSIKSSVETYEKKNGVKLHCAGVLPLLLWLLSQTGKETMSAAAVETVAGGVTAATGVTVAASSGGAAVATATATAAVTTTAATTAAGAGLAAKIATLPVVAKVIAGVIAGSLVLGGVGLAVLPEKEPAPPSDPTHATTDSSGSSLPGDDTGFTGELIPEGCKYIIFQGAELQAGERMPETPGQHDSFVTADYRYSFSGAGWESFVLDEDKTEYAPLLSTINGYPLVSVDFGNCKNMLSAPVIPETVTSLRSAFYNCSSMIVAPEIPAGVTDLTMTFHGCSSLKTAPVIPQGVTDLSFTFGNCTSLEAAPVIPESVAYMESSFFGCVSLTGIVEINATLAECIENCNTDAISCDFCYEDDISCINCQNCMVYRECFYLTEQPIILTGSCAELYDIALYAADGNITVDSPCAMPLPGVYDTIPEGCTYVTAEGITYTAGQALPGELIPGDQFITEDYTYYFQEYRYQLPNGHHILGGCSGWNARVKDPSKTSYAPLYQSINGYYVTSLSYTFSGCTNLVTPPAIPTHVTDMDSAFDGCTAMVCAPVIPKRVQDMEYAFRNCTSLTGKIIVHVTGTPSDGYYAATVDYRGCFYGTKLPITLTGTSNLLQELADTAPYGNITVG